MICAVHNSACCAVLCCVLCCLHMMCAATSVLCGAVLSAHDVC